MKQKKFNFSDGTSMIGVLVAKAAHILVIKVKSAFFIINKDELDSIE